MRWYGLIILTSALFVQPIYALSHQEVEVKMELSKSAVLLGEPVWVMMTARNVSKNALKFNPGDYCSMGRQMPIVAEVPDAAPHRDKPMRCEYGSLGGNCMMGSSTTTLAPGQSATWRYLLEGYFHFTHAGTYRVGVASYPYKVFQDKPVPTKPASVIQTLTLVVLPQDDAALLALEKQMAADVDAQTSQMQSPVPLSEDRDARFRQMQNLDQIRMGIAAHPAPGSESLFEHWLENNAGIVGLKNLNSKQSREELSKIAGTPNKPNSYIEEAATYALGEMGDSKYFPLMVELMASPDQRVRRAAIQGVGDLGGEAAVPVLLQEMRTAPAVERNDAMSGLGNTKSRAAVKALIDLTGGKGNDYQNVWWPLFVLTHHSLPQVTYLRTAEQTHDTWQRWWDAGGKDAPVYSPYDCAAKE